MKKLWRLPLLANVTCAEDFEATVGVLIVRNRAGGVAAPPLSSAAAPMSPLMAYPETPRPAVSQWADTPRVQPAAEGWSKAISALLLGTAALGLASTASRARVATPRMDLELGDMDAEGPSRQKEEKKKEKKVRLA